MIAWLENNLGTILTTLALAAIVALIIRGMIKDKKKGKHACCSDCAHCALCGTCGQKQQRV